jgi:hypothetical protein
MMTVLLFASRRQVSYATRRLAVAVLLLGAVLVVGLYLVSKHVRLTSTSAATSSEAAVLMRFAPPVQTQPSDCSVTGDLVGDGNPAEIAATSCGEARR